MQRKKPVHNEGLSVTHLTAKTFHPCEVQPLKGEHLDEWYIAIAVRLAYRSSGSNERSGYCKFYTPRPPCIHNFKTYPLIPYLSPTAQEYTSRSAYGRNMLYHSSSGVCCRKVQSNQVTPLLVVPQPPALSCVICLLVRSSYYILLTKH